jgi:tricorn protease
VRDRSKLVRVALLALGVSTPACARPGYYQFPDIHGDRVVFTAEGDLWTANVDGSDVRRITSHPGDEVLARFSPDGRLIAFTGDYDGNRDLFVIAADGGEPRRLTWNPAPDAAVGWTPDGARVLLRSRRHHPHASHELFSIPVAGGEPERLPLGWAARLAIDPETGSWAFTRFGNEFDTWKRYRGGEAEEIWVGHPDRMDFAPVTRFDGMDAFPMWHGGKIYFLSDRGGTANIWSMWPDGSDLAAHTQEERWDVRWPSMGPDGRIVYVLGADLHVFDPSDGSQRRLPLDLPSERALTRRRHPGPAPYLTEFDLSPDGERVLVVTRGEVFSVPAKPGVTLPISNGSGARERGVSFDRPGKQIFFISDESGEEELFKIDAWGRAKRSRVKRSTGTGWHYPPVASPDGKWVAYADETFSLYIVSVDGGDPIVVDRSEQWEISEYSFSPDGRWLAYSRLDRRDFASIHVYDTKEKRIHDIGGGATDDHAPVWDPDGRYLYFLGDRTIDPVVGVRDFTDILTNATKPYIVLLRPDVKNPFLHGAGLPSETNETKEEKEEKPEEDDEGPPKPVEIEASGLADRVIEVPVDAGRYARLAASPSTLFYLSFPLRGIADEEDDEAPRGTLMSFDLEKKEAAPFAEGVSAFDLAENGEKIAFTRDRGEIYVVETASPPGDDLQKSRLDLSDLVVDLDPQAEWRQMFREAWREMRDFYWDEDMAGLDWPGIHDQYAELLPRVATRGELRDLIGEMIGELTTSHTYTWGGDAGVEVPQYPVGLLGADLVRQGEAFRVDRIYRGDPADNAPSPLQVPGVDVREGHYILAVNHVSFPPDLPFEAAFENKAGKEVLLTVNDRPEPDGARDVVVTPLASEHRLRYVDWVRRNRELVAEKTGGKIGYIHLPDMGAAGLVAFDTWFYPQLDKEGMIVDVRWNGGGYVSQLILERLRRRLLTVDYTRRGSFDSYPYRVLNGPFVVIVNEFAGSDGDVFPAMVQLEKLAPVIGMRSWGGVIGIRMSKRLVDGGIVTQPEFAMWTPGRGWTVENRGVEPDVEVQNLPQELARGIDAQLDRAIAEVERLRTERPPVDVELGPKPDKSRAAFAGER